MRIVLDGAHGAGKSTFLYGSTQVQNNISIKKLGYPIFSDLIGDSFNEGKNVGVVPPKDQQDYNVLFDIIARRGLEQYLEGDGKEIYWYERGIHYINVIAEMDGYSVPIDILALIQKVQYDYVFVFDPIESCDFSNVHKMGCRSFTLEDRYDCVEKTCKVYEKVGNKVCRVPVFSPDEDENFLLRYNFMKKHVCALK